MLENENVEKLKQAWKGLGSFSLSRLGAFFNKRNKTKQNLTDEDIKKWLADPPQYQKEILNLSDMLYAPEGIYKSLVSLTVNMATLDYYVQPDKATMEKLLSEVDTRPQEKLEKLLLNFNDEFTTVRKYLADIDIKKTGRRILESLVRYGGYCGFEKNDGGFPYIWDLPIKYVRLYSVVDGQYKVEFNFKYFDDLMGDKELSDFAWDLYPPEFKYLYDRYKKNTERLRYPEWQPLPHQKVCCVKLGGDGDLYFLPLFSQLFNELYRLNDLTDDEIESAKDERVKLVHQELPVDKETGTPLIDPDSAKLWHKVVEDSLPTSVSLATSPFPLHDIPFKSIQEKKTELVEFARTFAYMQAGVNPLIMGGSSTNSSVGVTQNLQFIQSLVFSMLDKIQSWFNYRIYSINSKKKYTFILMMLKLTWYNQEEVFNREYKLLTVGGSITPIVAIAGYNPDNYGAMIEYENLLKVKDKWIPLKNMNQASSTEEGGRPQVPEGDLSPKGEVTRNTDGNKRE